MSKNKPLRIVFMGTPEFAVPSLKAILAAGHEVVGVITATDKYGGRGNKKLIESAVKKFAVKQGLKVLQPRNLKDPDFLAELAELNADLQVVVAFRMLPKAVWQMPTLGTINLHGSLLPRYRGAAPINWAVIKGEKETGVTTFFLKHEIDTGDLLFQKKMAIGENETAGEVHDRMMELGAEVVTRSVNAIASGDYELQPQDDSQVSKAPKIFHDTCQIDFNRSTEATHNFIRGLSPFPTAWTTLDGLKLKIYRTEKDRRNHDLAPGTIVSNGKNELKIATNDGFIKVLELQLQGRKRMPVAAFLNGYKEALTRVGE